MAKKLVSLLRASDRFVTPEESEHPGWIVTVEIDPMRTLDDMVHIPVVSEENGEDWIERYPANCFVELKPNA